MRDLWRLILTIQPHDIVDIALVSSIFFCLLLLLRESRSRVALEGLLTVLLLSFVAYFFARIFNFSALELIFERFWVIIVLAVLIVFQNEFKKALIDLGQLRIVRALFKHSSEYLDEMVAAAQAMSARRIGALIAIERRNPLRAYAETGVPVDSIVSSELLRTIFTPRSPLHDGAVIIRNERIVAGACILPLSGDPNLSKELGTRHRAAIGLSEETDALVLTVSEETGIVSLAVRGALDRNFSAEELRKRLYEELNVSIKDDEETGSE
ncbi:MAG: DNA integrity scanning protein DisA [candidate division BRC1 bacterium ADurb.BinA364]|nr:MAG: DNA integrity scanning protein DisA [candidate division BRC1 bacterium ADurb.BinA364]